MSWPFATIGDVCEVVNGGTPKTGVAAFWGGENMWITPAEMGGRGTPYVAETERRLTDAGLAATNLLPPYSVILSSRAPIGHLAINTVPMGTNQGCKGLVPKSSIDHKFLFYYLSSIVPLLNDLGTGTTFKELSGGNLKTVPIPLPPIPEQRRIVAILDEAFEAIATVTANAEKSLANSDDLFERSLDTIFAQIDGEQCKRVLSDLTEAPITYGVIKPGDEGEIVFVRGGDLVAGRVRVDKLRTITRTVSDQYRRTLLQGGELLICLVGQPGQVAVAPPGLAGANIARQVGLIRLKRGVDAEFVRYFLQSADGRTSLGARESGSVQQVINLGELRQVEVPIPTEIVQKSVVAKLDRLTQKTNRLRSTYRAKLVDLAELKQSILAKAFSGELGPAVLSSITPRFSANILALAYERHVQKCRQKTFGRVKAQKILHLVEATSGLDLGRNPIKDAAGPNDFPHMLRSEEWAAQQEFFRFRPEDGRYHFEKLGKYNQRLREAQADVRFSKVSVNKIIDLLLPMDSEAAEITATVFAAWNNLILDGREASDEEIVRASREEWHKDKLHLSRGKFFDAISVLRRNGLVPDGKAKRVGQKGLL